MGMSEDLVADFEARLRPLEVALGRAWWDASTHASEEADRRKAEIDLDKADAATE